MGKAYKCDICGGYCDDVYTIHGISNPGSHKPYEKSEDKFSFDCCVTCYDEIMQGIQNVMQKTRYTE